MDFVVPLDQVQAPSSISIGVVCSEGGSMNVSIPVSEAQVVAASCICEHESPCGLGYLVCALGEGGHEYSQFSPAFLTRNDKNQSSNPWLLTPEQTTAWSVNSLACQIPFRYPTLTLFRLVFPNSVNLNPLLWNRHSDHCC